MTRRRLACFVAALACAAACAMTAGAVTLADFERALEEIPIQSEARVVAALDLGLKTSCCFRADETYRLLERLVGASGSATDKEAIVLVIARAVEQGIPVDSLLNKAFEGLARGVPLASLGQLLTLRLEILIASRDLFGYRGIFRASPGAPVAAGAAALPAQRFDDLLSNFADTLGDYLEGGGSPFENQKIYNGVQARLTQLSGTVLNAADVDLVLSRIGPADLTQAVSPALR